MSAMFAAIRAYQGLECTYWTLTGLHGHDKLKVRKHKKKKQTYTARVHSTTMDEIPEGEPVTAGKFPINQHPVVVLFNSGSSYSFMSQAFAQKHE